MFNWVVENDAASERVASLMKGWLDKCDAEHPNCPKGETDLPTYLLDLENPSTIRVVRSSGQRGRYAALSYCWGDCRQFILTKDTYDDRLKGFSLEQLPKSFRDAIQVTRQLGLRYLWIDALCIIQDDIESWEQESARMCDYYSDAAVTILASNASDGRDGFLKERNSRYLPVDLVSGDMSERVYVQENSLNFNRVIEPLENRGWCLQELALSRRRLNFNTNSISWQCLMAVEDEHTSISFQPEYTYKWSAGQGERVWSFWYDRIHDFTARQLTRKSDRLPAMSGLAAQIAKSLGNDTYLAGLWKSNLGRELLWAQRLWSATSYQAVYSFRPAEARRRIEDSCPGPSWSWASLNSQVVITGVGHLLGENEEGLNELFEFVSEFDGSTEVPGQNPFGIAVGGVVKGCAPLLKVRPSVSNIWGRDDVDDDRSFYLDPEISNAVLSVSLDYPVDKHDSVVALPILSRGRRHGSRKPTPGPILGLLLSPLEDKEEFERIGVFLAKVTGEQDTFDLVSTLPRQRFLIR